MVIQTSAARLSHLLARGVMGLILQLLQSETGGTARYYRQQPRLLDYVCCDCTVICDSIFVLFSHQSDGIHSQVHVFVLLVVTRAFVSRKYILPTIICSLLSPPSSSPSFTSLVLVVFRKCSGNKFSTVWYHREHPSQLLSSIPHPFTPVTPALTI